MVKRTVHRLRFTERNADRLYAQLTADLEAGFAFDRSEMLSRMLNVHTEVILALDQRQEWVETIAAMVHETSCRIKKERESNLASIVGKSKKPKRVIESAEVRNWDQAGPSQATEEEMFELVNLNKHSTSNV